MSDSRPRRSSFVDTHMPYAAIGASMNADLLKFAPEGSVPFESEVHVGDGETVFDRAVEALLTWSAHRASGVAVSAVHTETHSHYTPVTFDNHGTPQPRAGSETRFGADGEPFLTAGSSALLTSRGDRAARKWLVVSQPESAHSAGMVLATADDSGVIGEVFFNVALKEAGSVFAQARGFFTPTASRRAAKRAAKRATKRASLGSGFFQRRQLRVAKAQVKNVLNGVRSVVSDASRQNNLRG